MVELAQFTLSANSPTARSLYLYAGPSSFDYECCPYTNLRIHTDLLVMLGTRSEFAGPSSDIYDDLLNLLLEWDTLYLHPIACDLIG